MRVVARDLAGVEVADDDAARTTVLHDEVEHLRARIDGDRAETDLAGERLVAAEQQLLAGLATGVEGARHLRAAEAAVVEQPAVLACERHTLRDALVDDVDGDLREPVHVRFAGAVVAALHGVVEEAIDRVAVTLVVLRRVDAALRRDRVRAPGRVVEREGVDVVAELAERCRGGAAGETGADDDDLEPAAVVRSDELHVELVLVPHLLDRSVGDLGVEQRLARLRVRGRRGHSSLTSLTLVLRDHDVVLVLVERQDVGLHQDREAAVADHDDGRERSSEVQPPLVEAGVVPPEALEQAPRAVEDVDAERDVGDDVEDRDGGPAACSAPCCCTGRRARSPGLANPHVRSARCHARNSRTMIAGPPHGARREVGGHVVAMALVLLGPGAVVQLGEDVRGVDVQDERGDEPEAQQPQDQRAGQRSARAARAGTRRSRRSRPARGTP